MERILVVLDELKEFINARGGEGFEVDLVTVEELATVCRVEDCVCSFEEQIKRKFDDAELQYITTRLKEIEHFNENYTKLQAQGADAELAALDVQTAEEVA